MKNPRVTVLMPLYNGEKFLREAIASILGQTFADFELLIVDDGSTDSSAEIVTDFRDGRIQFVRNTANLGIEASLNLGLEMARGEFIARMDCDDISLPLRLKKQVEFLTAHPEVAACGTWLKTFGKCSAEWRFPLEHDEIMARMIFQNSLPHAPVMLRKGVLRCNRLNYRADFPGAEDYDLWTRLMTRARLANLPEVLYYYRQYDQQVTRSRSAPKTASANRVRKAVLEGLGIEMSDDEFQLHCKIALNLPGYSLSQAEVWLEKIEQVNGRSNFFEPEALRKVLGRIWFVCCSRAAHSGLKTWGAYWAAPLSGFATLGVMEKLKFFIKCAIRK